MDYGTAADMPAAPTVVGAAAAIPAAPSDFDAAAETPAAPTDYVEAADMPAAPTDGRQRKRRLQAPVSENHRLWPSHIGGTVRVTGRLLDRSKALKCEKKYRLAAQQKPKTKPLAALPQV